MHRTSVAAVVVLFVAVLQLSARTDPTQEGCATLQPGPDWTCANGNWYPPGYPIPAPDPSECTTIRPGEEWFCFNGNWYPPGFPVPGGTSTPPPPPPPSETTCTTVQPGPDWTCFNGGWLPPGILGTCNTALSSGGGFLDSITTDGAGEAVHLFVLVEPTFSCLWSAISDVSWITLDSPAFPDFFPGDGDVRFTVQPNTTGAERIGHVLVAEKVLTVIQPAQ